MVRSLSRVASMLRVSEFFAAFVLMALSTSLPELFVSISSGITNTSSLALGVVIGSNIANLSLIAGIGIVIAKGYMPETITIKRDTRFMFLVSLVPVLLLMHGGSLSRIDGVILILIFFAYSAHLLREQHFFHKESHAHLTRWQKVQAPALFVGMLIVLFASSYFTVFFAEAIAFESVIAPVLIGLVLIAIGTSLPELSFTVNAFLNHKGDLSLGNLIGSVVANSTLVLGIAAILSPIHANLTIAGVAAIFMLITTFLFYLFIEQKNHITTREGVVLIIVYLFFIVTQVYLPTL